MTYPKISKSAIFQTGSDVSKIRLDNFLPCPMPTYPENFMKIRPRVCEKTSKKKKKKKKPYKNNKVFRWKRKTLIKYNQDI